MTPQQRRRAHLLDAVLTNELAPAYANLSIEITSRAVHHGLVVRLHGATATDGDQLAAALGWDWDSETAEQVRWTANDAVLIVDHPTTVGSAS